MWVCFPILFKSITIQKVSMQVSTNHILKTKNKYHFRSVPKLSSNAKAVFHFLLLFFNEKLENDVWNTHFLFYVTKSMKCLENYDISRVD